MKHSSRGNIPRFAVPFIVSTISLLLVCFAFFSHSATAAIPSTMNFQGRLTDSTGTIMPDGLYNMQLTGGSATWSETREVSGTDYRVQVTNGLFSTQLGQRTALPASLFANTDLYFEITMANPATATCNTTSCQTWESPMTSRQKLATSAYAFNSDTLDGLDSTAFAAATGSTNYIQNTTTLQTADFTISGTGRVDTVLQAPSIQRTTNGTLLVGTTATTTGMTLGSTSLTGTLALDSGAASTITIGSSASTRTINIGNVAAIQTVTLGSTNTTSATTIQGGATGSITLATGGTINLNAGTVATNAATANFLNTTATTVNAFGAGTAITIGANSGTTTIRNSNVVVGNTTTRGTFTNNGATVSATLALGDLAAGAIGTAAATVDIYTGVTISPTVAGRTYTVPSPTSTTAGRQFYISNINATNSFTILGQTIAPTSVVTLVWGGAAWSISSTGSAAGANTSLSNLSGVNLGTTALNSTSNNLNLTTTTSGNIILNSAGTIELQDAVNITGNLGVTGTITGTSTVQGTQLISTVATGTAPLTIASTTKVTNLNVDSLDGLDSTAFGQLSANNTWTGTNTYNVTNASALKVQNAGGTALLTADTSSGAVIFGQSSSLSGKLTLANSSNANTVSIVSGVTSSTYSLILPTSVGTTGQCLSTTVAGSTSSLGWASCGGGGGSTTKKITLTPEYAGAVIKADGTNNNGTMTSDFINGLTLAEGYKHNYYDWTTSQATAQDYDIIINHQLPSDFNATTEFDATSWKIWTYVDSVANSTITMTVYDADGTACANGVSIKGASTGWTQVTLTDFDTNANCDFTANSIVTVKLSLSSMTPSTNHVRVAEFEYSYTN